MRPDRSLVRPITRADIKGPAIYAGMRDDFRKRVIELKRPRRVVVGDRVSMTFENRHTLTLQIEEMCRVENLTTDEQIDAEVAVYNELMPTADSLSATLFIELHDGDDHYAELNRLVGLDEHVALWIGPDEIRAAFEPGRSTNDKISAVQYLRFPLSPGAKELLRNPETTLAIVIDHPEYMQQVSCDDSLRASLAADYED